MKMTAFRLDPVLLWRLDRAAEVLTVKYSVPHGRRWNRTDALRYLVGRGLAELGIPKEKGKEQP